MKIRDQSWAHLQEYQKKTLPIRPIGAIEERGPNLSVGTDARVAGGYGTRWASTLVTPMPCHVLIRCVAFLTLCLSLVILVGCNSTAHGQGKIFRAGAYAIDITPTKFPVEVNGMFESRQATRAYDSLHARCLVLDDGQIRLAIVVVDSLMLPRELLDEAKELARGRTGIPTNRMLISATHTHFAPSAMGMLGSEADADYVKFLPGQIALGIERANENLASARVGWAVIDAPEYTYCRRWILRPDKVRNDPFGQPTVRAMMHPGYQNPDFLAPSGPVDPELSLLSVQSPEGRPVALLANYSMHYFGTKPLSADYFGKFAEKITQLVGAEKAEPPFVGIMSQGTSGDLMWMDYSQPEKSLKMDAYAGAVAQRAYEGYKSIEYHDWVPLAMAEKTLTLGVRLPSKERLAWAQQILAHMEGPKPAVEPNEKGYESLREIYAREQVMLEKRGATRELKLQAIRIGGLGITGIPNEVFGVTGLKIKAFSPLKPTFTIELANGAEGYIPPPEQHELGGYTTWAARSAGLEVNAALKITDAVLDLLSEVSGKPSHPPMETQCAYDLAILASRPAAFWRLHEFNGPQAADASGKSNSGTYEKGVVYYLEGPQLPGLSAKDHVERAAQFAGGGVKGTINGLGGRYSVEMWFYNELPVDLEGVTGYLFSRGLDGAKDDAGDHLGLGGRDLAAGKLFFSNGKAQGEILQGKTEILAKTWNHVVMVREDKRVAVYLNGKTMPEISGEARLGFSSGPARVIVGSDNDNINDFYGKICEVSIYNRALTLQEIAKHYSAAVGGQPVQ